MGIAVMWFTGLSKKPWIASWCRSIAIMLSAPAVVSRSGDELRRDRLARSGLAILAGVAVMRDDGGLTLWGARRAWRRRS